MTDSLLLREYDKWFNTLGKLNNHVPLIIIDAVHSSQSIEGIEEIPSWILDEILELHKEYKKSNKLILGSAGGNFDYTEAISSFDKLYFEN